MIGWVPREQMELTLKPTATRRLSRLTIEGLHQRPNGRSVCWPVTSAAPTSRRCTVGTRSTPNVSVEVWGSQILGNFSNGWMGSVNVVHEAFPEWRFSPFFTMGAGVIHTEPKSTIVQGEDRTDQIGHVGAGFRVYITRRFVLPGLNTRATWYSRAATTTRK